MPDSTTYSTSINPGPPPLRWDNVLAAFEQVNANFEMLSAALGASGLTPINFSDLDSSVIPSQNGVYTLGSLSNRWKSIFSSSYNTVPGNEFNGLWAGDAHIKGIGTTVELPANSTVSGQLIIDPDKNWFQTIQVDNNESIVANTVNDSFNILSGAGILLNVDSSAESLTITNSGVVTASAGPGISVSGTNPLNITNTGVLSLANAGAIGTRTSGLGIHVSSNSGNPIITNTGVLSLSAGVGITVSLDAVTGDVTVSNSAPAVNTFAQVEIDGDSFNRLVADSVSDTLNINSGYGINLSKNTGTDTLTISFNPSVDIKGSVFADDSSIMVDAVSRQFIGTLIGELKGSVFADDSSVLVDAINSQFYGALTGQLTGSVYANNNQLLVDAAGGILPAAKVSGTFTTIATNDKIQLNGNTNNLSSLISTTNNTISSLNSQLGSLNGQVFLPPYGGNPIPGPNPSILAQISQVSGQLAQANSDLSRYNSLLSDPNVEITYIPEEAEMRIDKTLSVSSIKGSLIGDVKGSVFSDNSTILVDAVSGRLQGSFFGNVFTNLIDSEDSAQILVTPLMRFESDVVVENDLTVNNLLLVRGSRIIRLDDFKSLVAASSSFADFQTLVAAL